MPVNCEKLKDNRNFCNCSYEGCSRQGNCCACLQYHIPRRELPACAFPDDVEKSWDRSFERFIRAWK